MSQSPKHTKIKLSYFDFSGGRGEECRLALHLANIDFEDHRFVFDDWSSIKPKTPYGEVPVIEFENEEVLAQSNAILWLIGSRYGLLPENDFETARHLAILSAIEDLTTRISNTFSMSDEEKETVRKKIAEGYMKHWASNIEKQIQGSYITGEKISVADLKLYVLVKWIKDGDLDYFPADYFEAYPKIVNHYSMVSNHPKVVDWQQKTNQIN